MNKQQVFKLSEHVNVTRVGGKAYALGKMLRAGFIIPDGYVISAEVFNGMTPALNDVVLSAFDKLGTEFVAVRSSAVNEDGIDAAWAGQLDTFLNCTRENLIQSVNAYRESASNARAQSYAHQKGIEATKVAVIVQAMVESEVSGVVFSAHPVSGDTTQMVIEAGLGLGEAVVSGQITPDTYILDKKKEKLIEKHVALQNKKLIRSDVGTTVWLDVGVEGAAQKLSDEQIINLCKVTEKIEKFFSYPVDVEWALSNGKMYILQSRPVTILVRT
jgi:phosphoenolpyruvate synthase/pyruvate phosphate dikinase